VWENVISLPYGQTCLTSMLDIQSISWAKKEEKEDMSYAIIGNEKLTRAESYGAYVHNDRKAKIIQIRILIQRGHI